jgi:luciferase family oxidoreductase group 1
MYAMRRDARSSDNFPRDVVELQGYLGEESRVRGVDAVPGKGSHVPLYILGSSLFGAKLAAVLGLPYAFASHFAPDALLEAIAAYRSEFQPSEQLDKPYVMAGVNVLAADSADVARQQLQEIRRIRAISLHGRRLGVGDQDVTDEQADELLAAGVSVQVDHMLTYTAAGTPAEVRDYLDDFVLLTGADELVTVHQVPTAEGRMRSVTLLAEALDAVKT